MSVVPIDGYVKVTFASSIATTAAPTVAELNAGTAMQDHITPDGLDITPNTGKRNTSNLGSRQNTYKAGRIEYDIELTLHHASSTDTPYNLLPYNTDGFLVVRRGVLASTAWAANDKVEVYPVNTGEPMEVKPAENGNWDFKSPMFVSAVAETRAVVAA